VDERVPLPVNSDQNEGRVLLPRDAALRLDHGRQDLFLLGLQEEVLKGVPSADALLPQRLQEFLDIGARILEGHGRHVRTLA
jgi:hypothetical protein